MGRHVCRREPPPLHFPHSHSHTHTLIEFRGGGGGDAVERGRNLIYQEVFTKEENVWGGRGAPKEPQEEF